MLPLGFHSGQPRCSPRTQGLINRSAPQPLLQSQSVRLLLKADASRLVGDIRSSALRHDLQGLFLLVTTALRIRPISYVQGPSGPQVRRGFRILWYSVLTAWLLRRVGEPTLCYQRAQAALIKMASMKTATRFENIRSL